jgi:glutaredoxin 2
MAPSKPLPLYLKPGCPFCCKTVVFLAERGWLDQVEFRGDSEEERKMIQDKLGKVSFPCLEREDGTLMLESEDVGIYIAKLNGVDVTELHGKAVDYYLTVKDGYIAAYQERIALKKELEELKAK